ncbi:MAG TPA: type II secretion system protein [Phycisphaerae bacterium]|nr:type II secretion system protein [Phycisphaerae bacterium]
MKAKAGFTLTELLVVIGIGLILVAGSVSVLVALSGRIGPRQAVSTVQAMLNGARFHAVSDQVKAAAVVFESEAAGAEHGTKLSIWVARRPSSGSWDWEPVPGAEESLPASIFVINMPTNLHSGEGDQNHREGLAEDIKGAWSNQPFCALFGPTGVMLRGSDVTGSDLNDLPGSISTSQVVELGLVVFRVTGDAQDQIGDFVFYPLNVNAGTRLVFE